MSETAPRELMVLVERVVRPLPIPLSRQKRLRTEFLDHLQAIYGEELTRDSDPALAFERTRSRFGVPQELTAELRSAIPWWEKWESWSERALARGPQETATRHALRIISRFIIFLSSVWLLMMLDHQFFGTEKISLLKLKVGIAALTFLAVWFGGFLLFGLQSGAEWERPQRRWSRIALFSLVLVASWPASLAMMMQLAGGSWSEYSTPLIGSVLGGLMSVAGGTFVGVLHHRETNYRREWSELDLDAA